MERVRKAQQARQEVRDQRDPQVLLEHRVQPEPQDLLVQQVRTEMTAMMEPLEERDLLVPPDQRAQQGQVAQQDQRGRQVHRVCSAEPHSNSDSRPQRVWLTPAQGICVGTMLPNHQQPNSSSTIPSIKGVIFSPS